MKTKTRFFLVPLIFNLLININFAYTQADPFDSVAANNEAKDAGIKNFTAKYFEKNVYLKVIINGLNKTSVFKVERSLDGEFFEDIGSFLHYGTDVNIDILNCYTDNCPYNLITFYRVVRYDTMGNKLTSETVCVFPDDSDEIITQQELTERK
ncbi:MAG: hypothetical protein V1904_13100 [Bacteroidota bacterium]